MAADPFVGEIIMFAGNYAPPGWAICDGRMLPIAQYQALYSILGTTYGGDSTTFALPDLRGRVTVGAGTAPGLTPRKYGQKFGTETNILTNNNLPTHTHQLTGNISIKCADEKADTHVNKGNPLAKNAFDIHDNDKTIEIYKDKASATYDDGYDLGGVTKGDLAVANSGNSQPVNNMQPSIVLNFIIALEGLYPVRN